MPLLLLSLPAGVQTCDCGLLALSQQRQPCLRAACLQTQCGTVGTLHGLVQCVRLQLHQALLQALQVCMQVALVRHQ